MSIAHGPSSSDLPPEKVAQIRIDGMTRRLRELRGLISEAKKEEELLANALKDHIRETGEVIEVEGLPPLRLVQESSGYSWDCEAMQEDELLWRRVTSTRGLLTINKKVLDAVEDAGLLTGVKRFGWTGQRDVLRFDRK